MKFGEREEEDDWITDDLDALGEPEPVAIQEVKNRTRGMMNRVLILKL